MSRVSEGRRHPLPALPHRPVGEPHHGEGRKARAEIDLNAHEEAVHAAHGGGSDHGEHGIVHAFDVSVQPIYPRAGRKALCPPGFAKPPGCGAGKIRKET